MLEKNYKTHLLYVLLMSVMLCQCTTTVNSITPTTMPLAKEAPKKVPSPYKLPTAEYLAEAKSQEGTPQQDALLSAAGSLITKGEWYHAAAILAQTQELTAVQKAEKNVLLAKVDMMRDNTKAALSKLAAVKDPSLLSPYLQIQYHKLLAQAYKAKAKPLESINERIKLEALLPDEASLMRNRKELWLTLTHIPQAELETLAVESSAEEPLQGWLQLALIARKYQDNSQSLLAALDQWQTRFSTHPANQILPTPLDSIAEKLRTKPRKVALLLPLSGPLSGPGAAIKDGFMAAYSANTDQAKTKIQVYDTDKGDVAATYQQALDDGAQYVVGPLTKNQVATVAALSHPVPTLLLNDADVSSQENSYSFGLSPSYEASQVALKARSKGYQNVLIIGPNNDWGNEVTKAFTNQWRAKGGRIADTYAYAEKEDLNAGIRSLLQISSGQEREKRVKELLGYNVQVAVSRRQDFDVVFLLAYPSKARQIMPLLKYYYAADVPVFATSSVYGGSANALKDKDLDGIIFCDTPWVFAHQAGTRNWPEQFNSYNRLYALGMDSFALATKLNQLIVFPAETADGLSGTLYLKPSQQVARVLEWGQFSQGLAHSLKETS